MGIYVSKYIDYRAKDGKWHLLESFVPKTDENSKYNEELPTIKTSETYGHSWFTLKELWNKYESNL